MMNRMARDSLSDIRDLACRLVGEALQHPVEAVSMKRVGGGCISDAFCLTTCEARFFVKVNSSPIANEMFRCEAAGLELLRSSRFLIPKTLGFGQTKNQTAILVLEWVEPEKPGENFFEQMGRILADMHLHVRRDHFGLDYDNFIGQSVQKNTPSNCWIDFWRNQRLGFQLDLASRNGLLDLATRKRAEKLCDRLDRWLDEPDGDSSLTGGGSLLHGDLWQGNYLAGNTGGDTGRPTLVDPAVYFGHRESEFAMIGLFGGFGPGFFDAYDEVCRPVDGFADRMEIYKLYHLLNHLNLFGTSYLPQCQQIIDRFVDQ